MEAERCVEKAVLLPQIPNIALSHTLSFYGPDLEMCEMLAMGDTIWHDAVVLTPELWEPDGCLGSLTIRLDRPIHPLVLRDAKAPRDRSTAHVEPKREPRPQRGECCPAREPFEGEEAGVGQFSSVERQLPSDTGREAGGVRGEKYSSRWVSSLSGYGDGHYCLTCYFGTVFYYLGGALFHDRCKPPIPVFQTSGFELDCVDNTVIIFFSPCTPFVVLTADLLCLTPACIMCLQGRVRERFGVPGMPVWQLLFCRCASARIHREAAMRGYLQPQICCGPTKEQREEAFRNSDPSLHHRPVPQRLE